MYFQWSPCFQNTQKRITTSYLPDPQDSTGDFHPTFLCRVRRFQTDDFISGFRSQSTRKSHDHQGSASCYPRVEEEKFAEGKIRKYWGLRVPITTKTTSAMKKPFSLIPQYLPSARKVFDSIRSSQPRPTAFPLEALGTRQPTRTDEVESLVFHILSLLGNLKRLHVTPDHKPKENYSQIREKSFLFHFAFDLYGSKQLFNLQYAVFVRRARRVAKLTWIQCKTECWIEPVFRENLGGKVQNAFTAPTLLHIFPILFLAQNSTPYLWPLRRWGTHSLIHALSHPATYLIDRSQHTSQEMNKSKEVSSEIHTQVQTKP